MVDLVPQALNTAPVHSTAALPQSRRLGLPLTITPPHLAALDNQRLATRVMLADASPISIKDLTPVENFIQKEIGAAKHNFSRFVAFANEVFESTKHYVEKRPSLLKGLKLTSYGISFGYCGIDAYKEAKHLYKESIEEGMSQKASKKRAALMFFDKGVLFHGLLASVVIPGLIVGQINHGFHNLLKEHKPKFAASHLGKASVALVGLASIPALVSVLDPTANLLLNHTTRKWFNLPKEEVKYFNAKKKVMPLWQDKSMPHTDNYHAKTNRVKSQVFGIFA